MARIALTSFLHETNTFSPVKTTFENFKNEMHSAQEVLEKFRGKKLNSALSGFFDIADKLEHEVVPIISFTEAEPSGTIPEEVFEKIITMITSEMAENGPYDAVYIDLHGALVYGDYQAGEPEIIKRIRKTVGNLPVVASLDTHGNIGQETFDLASGLVGYRTYPHIDIYETGQRCAALLDQILSGKPYYKAYRQLPFLMPVSSQSTNTEPAKSIFAMINEFEKDPDVYSASILDGFPSADMPDMGPCVLAYAATQETADSVADDLFEALLQHEGEFISILPGPKDAVKKALQLAATSEKAIILADVEDNAGGGSSSDTVQILAELIGQGAKNAALGLMVDPEAALAAHEAGEGAQITIPLGGKLIPGQTPLQGTFEVVKLADGDFLGTGPMMKDFVLNLGKMAQLRIGGVEIAVSSGRTQMLDQSYFRQVGINPQEKKILVLKSSNHYRADFEHLSSRIISVSAPAGTIENPAKGKYKNLRKGVRLCGLGPVNQ